MTLYVKAITIGPTGAGKSSLLNRIVNNKFQRSTLPTIGVDFFKKEYPKKKLNVTFWDTAGQEHYNSVSVSYYRNSAIIICIFDLNDKEGIDDIIKKLKECQNSCNSRNIISLIGNKSDQKIDSETLQINADKVSDFCHNFNALYYQVSCATGENCSESIELILDTFIQDYEKNKYQYKNVENMIEINIQQQQYPSSRRNCCDI